MTSVSAEAGVDPVTSEKATAGRLEDREEGEATSRLTYLSHALEASAGLLAPHRLRVRRTAQFFFCAENPSRFGGVRCRRGNVAHLRRRPRLDPLHLPSNRRNSQTRFVKRKFTTEFSMSLQRSSFIHYNRAKMLHEHDGRSMQRSPSNASVRQHVLCLMTAHAPGRPVAITGR